MAVDREAVEVRIDNRIEDERLVTRASARRWRRPRPIIMISLGIR